MGIFSKLGKALDHAAGAAITIVTSPAVHTAVIGTVKTSVKVVSVTTKASYAAGKAAAKEVL